MDTKCEACENEGMYLAEFKDETHWFCLNDFYQFWKNKYEVADKKHKDELQTLADNFHDELEKMKVAHSAESDEIDYWLNKSSEKYTHAK